MPNELQTLRNERVRFMVALEQLLGFELECWAYLDYAAEQRLAWRRELWSALTENRLEDLTA